MINTKEVTRLKKRNRKLFMERYKAMDRYRNDEFIIKKITEEIEMNKFKVEKIKNWEHYIDS